MELQSLFLDGAVEIEGSEKLAGMKLKLSDTPENWPQEIIQEAYRQVPYLGGFETHVILDRVDEERGYAFGSIEVTPKTSMDEGEKALYGMSKAHIPVVVQDQMLFPLDLFLRGKKYSRLTEPRLKEALFRPAVFDSVKTPPLEASMLINDMMPPNSTGRYGSGFKTAAVVGLIPILPQLNGRVLPEHKERLEKEASNPSVRAAIFNANEGVQAAFASAFGLDTMDREKSASLAWDMVRPDVVQITKHAGHYMLKWANTDIYQPQQEEVGESDIQGLLSGDEVGLLESDGSITVSPNAAIKQTMDEEEIKTVDQFGLWSVQDTVGSNIVGWCFPQLLSLDMQPMPLTLFNNGSQYSLQDFIAGKLVGKSTDIPKGVPRGYGSLYYINHGNARAFVPMRIKSSYSMGGQLTYVAEVDTGEQVTVTFVDDLKIVTKMGEGEYAVPSNFSWMPLKAQVELVRQPDMFTKTANRNRAGTVEIVGDGDIYSFRGSPVVKLARDYTQFVNRRDAEFMCAALGMTQSFTKTALDNSGRGELVTVKGVRTITPAQEKIASAFEKVRGFINDIPHPIKNFSLVKEAALLDDALTVDKVLGLGFLNAENVATFVDMLPCLEETSSKLAELLLSARLGLREVPEIAVERVLVAMEDVIRGLKALQQKELTFSE